MEWEKSKFKKLAYVLIRKGSQHYINHQDVDVINDGSVGRTARWVEEEQVCVVR